MEQIYMFEVFIDTLTVYVNDGEESAANKSLIAKVKFGPGTVFIIKENQLASGDDDKKDDQIVCDENGKRKWSRTLRTGKSFLFPSYPDTILQILSKFPLEIELWNDDETEEPIFVGVGKMIWDKTFFPMLKESSDAHKLHQPLAIKQKAVLNAECCCKICGEISIIARLSALGSTIITEYQQLMKDPEHFVFRTNKSPSMFDCKRVEGDDLNFCMIGSLYETTTLEDPELMDAAQKTIDICTELESCGAGPSDPASKCERASEILEPGRKAYPIENIRMGDITGPCGNNNCPLAHKVKMYLRNLDCYKAKAGFITTTKGDTKKNVCGACDCKDDKWHRAECPELAQKDQNGPCSGCSEKLNCDENNTGSTPKGNPTKPDTKVAFVFNVNKVPGFKDAAYGNDYTIEDLYSTGYDTHTTNSLATYLSSTLCYQQGTVSTSTRTTNMLNEASPTNNTEKRDPHKQTMAVYACTELQEEKDCRCRPPVPSAPCKTFDCECIAKVAASTSRKRHKPYCPNYQHKPLCPVNPTTTEEDKKEDDDDEIEPLPYGLPPIQLGPCPVMGRPCSVPDGFTRMYKNALQPTLPPSYDDAGKVCCSKEFNRIKQALKEYMTYEKEHDFRCLNRFSVDTERRCCDKEQYLMSLMGKGCCGAHKLAIQEKYKDQKK